MQLPLKYSPKAIRVDRRVPLLVRAAGRVVIPHGKQRIILRAHNAARLSIDGRQVAETPFFDISPSAHGKVTELDRRLGAEVRAVPRGDRQAWYDLVGDGREHFVVVEWIVGGGGRRPELGESIVAMGPPNSVPTVLGFADSIPLIDEAWHNFIQIESAKWQRINRERRRAAGAEEESYWRDRHDYAEEQWRSLRPAIPVAKEDSDRRNAIDRYIERRLTETRQQATSLLGDAAFLRRVTLDVWGIVPTAEMVREFLADRRPDRRQRLVDSLLQDPRWADHWVGYWQDVLAENPNIIKPTLNNSGPFRWWIYESFLDNKPIDRFVTELIMMEGSRYFGGPAGFELATENDVPMAAKARIVAQAFLGVELKCARCHDDPYREFKQRDLFELAAMLKRAPQPVPATSSIPGGAGVAESLIVEVTLSPGEQVTPAFPFRALHQPALPQKYLRHEGDLREQLALWVTSPHNRRFARVIANRMWRFYLGYGLVEPVDDWPADDREALDASHPELLDYLAWELATHDYDLKHLARLILNSQTYQRTAVSREGTSADELALFRGPVRRRLRAEQIVDSLMAICGKPFDTGPITLDSDGALAAKTALNLGEPTRAWQFASLANERDRPSLAMPFAQPFISLMETFGWRSSRQDPLTVRPELATVLQPAILNNGLVVQRVVRLSDDNSLTQLALRRQSVEQLIETTFLTILSRPPDEAERQWFAELLRPGYNTRSRAAAPVRRTPAPRGLVSWSNHLSSRANEIKVELQAVVRQGDPPTEKLDPDWRKRMEDMVWVLLNSPEFVFVP